MDIIDFTPVHNAALKPSDLAMLVDRDGSLWIAYTDGDGTWVERRH